MKSRITKDRKLKFRLYREGARDAKDVKNKKAFALIQDLQEFLGVLRVFAVKRFYRVT